MPEAVSRYRALPVMGGQSAIELSALLDEAGATVDAVPRRPVPWLAPDRASERTIFEQLLAPNASIGPGWQHWMLEHMPYVFSRFPQEIKDKDNGNYVSVPTDWLRDRVIGKTTLHKGQTAVKLEAVDGRVHVTISDGEKVRTDRVVLATGYNGDIRKLGMLHASLRTEIETDMGVPILSRWFESSVPRLYFVGPTSLRAFGPLYRFVAGCKAIAERVARSVARKQVERPLAVTVQSRARDGERGISGRHP